MSSGERFSPSCLTMCAETMSFPYSDYRMGNGLCFRRELAVRRERVSVHPRDRGINSSLESRNERAEGSKQGWIVGRMEEPLGPNLTSGEGFLP